MRKSKFSPQQRTAILAKLDAGQKAEALSREYQVSVATLYKWQKDAKEESNDMATRLKQLEEENKRLKKLYANLSLDHDILQTGYDLLKKLQAQDTKKKY